MKLKRRRARHWGSLQGWVSRSWPQLGSSSLLRSGRFFLHSQGPPTVFSPTRGSTEYNPCARRRCRLVASHLISKQALNSKWPMHEISLWSQFNILCDNFLQ